MTRCSATMLAALGGTLLAGSALAQSTAPAAAPMPMPTKAERAKDVRYFLVETIEAKPGARLWEIISKHFVPAAKAAGVPLPIVYHTEMGTPRSIIITPLTNGVSDLDWDTSPEDVKWLAALAKQEGGADKAMALVKEYNDGILTRSRELVHEHVK